jgi:hypothetical protein
MFDLILATYHLCRERSVLVMYDLNNGCLTLDCLHLPVIQ